MLKKGLVIQCIIWSYGSVSSINSVSPISSRRILTSQLLMRVRMKLPPSYFFLDTELLLIDLELGTHTKKLKNFLKSNNKKRKNKKKLYTTWQLQWLTSSYISIFYRKSSFYLILLDCKLSFSWLFSFLRVLMSFL